MVLDHFYLTAAAAGWGQGRMLKMFAYISDWFLAWNQTG
jgi:hypothetical protein